MRGLRRREAYWDDPAARSAFKAFLHEIHNLDLSRWEAAGHWDDAYRPFSLFDDEGRVVSSLCVYSLDLVVDEEPVRGAQISGVGTLPAFRRKGLNRGLTELALDWARDTHDFFFLFSDEEAIPFYERCGFQRLEEFIPHIDVTGQPTAPARRLDTGRPEDLALVRRLGAERSPVSNQLGVLSLDLLVFHALYPLRELLHYVEALDAIVAFQRNGDRVAVHEVIASRMPTWKELAPYVVNEETRDVSFSFCADRLGVRDVKWHLYPVNDLHDRGDMPLRGRTFVFPYTAHA